jgi:two-component system response regulator AtoC
MSERIFLVDDDTDALEVYRVRLSHGGYEVETADSAEKALAKVKAFDPALIVTDVRMPGMSGLELLERVQTAMSGVSVVVMTGHEDMETAVYAMKAGAFDFLVKPVDPKDLQAVAERCFRERALAHESEEPEGGEEEEVPSSSTLVGRDPRMIEIYKTIGMLARNRATVLIRGETGTGKEVIARAIHQHSAFADEPFVAVNCTALTDTLLESELFGHTKGSFTGAVSARRGYFELARGGTVFLDEIGDTSPEFQTKLLRVLQERTFYPVGGETPLSTDARIITATHQPIEHLIEAGSFREDLYFRLKVVEIRVPALRERAGDIPRLANAMLTRIRERIHGDVRRISDEAMHRLARYPWPGNVRELENALMRAAILARGPVIGVDHLALGNAMLADEDLSLSIAVTRHVRWVLDRVGGDETEAAKLLGISAEEMKGYLAASGDER